MEVRIIAGATVAVVVVLVVVIIMTVLFLRRYVLSLLKNFNKIITFYMTLHFPFYVFSRGNDECNKKQPSDCDTLEYRNGEGKNTVFFGSYIFKNKHLGPALVKFTKNK